MTGGRVVIRFNHLPNVRRNLPKNTGALVRAIGFEMERYVKQSFGNSPSPAGGPPGVDTGALKSSIHVKPIDALTVEVADEVDYGVHLEYGTTKMAARPFMLPGMVWVANEVGRIAQDISWL